MFVNNIKLDVQSTMSTANNQYLSGILTGQNLTNAELDSLRSLRQQIEDQLSTLEGSPRFYYGGSFGKRTMGALFAWIGCRSPSERRGLFPVRSFGGS
jgi:hypothetical protein